MEDREKYRKHIASSLESSFQITSIETNLLIYAGGSENELKKYAMESVIRNRGFISEYIKDNPHFLKSLEPLVVKTPCPEIIKEMSIASVKAGVGPMASVAGVISEFTGRDLLNYTDQVIVENGGDIFLKVNDPVTLGIFAGKSKLSMKVGLRVSSEKPVSVCTSSGTIGHSLSFGKSDAVTVISENCALSDAAATSIGNCVGKEGDIKKAISFGKNIEGVKGIVVIIGDKIGAWGDIDLIKL